MSFVSFVVRRDVSSCWRSQHVSCGACAAVIGLFFLLAPQEGLSQRVASLRTESVIPTIGTDYVLGRVTGIAPLPSGDVAVLSWDDKKILLFDSAGRLVRSIGRQGAGPGEFTSPSALGRIGDTLWVWDRTLARITLISARGTLVRTVPAREPGHAVPLADGSIAVWRVASPGTRLRQSDTVVIRRYAGVQQPMEVFRARVTYRTLSVPGGQGSIVGGQPFDDNLLISAAFDGSGFAIVDRTLSTSSGKNSLIVLRISERGDTTWRAKLTFRAVNVSKADVDAVIDRLQPPGNTPRDPGLAARLRRALYVPDYFPSASGVIVGRDGSVWLRREDRPASQSIRWSVLTPSGKPDFEIDLGKELTPFAPDGQVIWALESAQDGPRVKRLRIVHKK